MKTLEEFKDKKVLILGYALTGRSVAEFLLQAGAQITINDREDLSQDLSIQDIIQQGVKVIDKGHPIEILESGFDYIVKNPGIPYKIDLIQEALKRDIPIYTDVELASWICPGSLIGITGSNGKTTTSQLIYQILSQSEQGQTYLAGNIGYPILKACQAMSNQDNLVAELSSFQLQGTRDFHPDIAVIINIYSAHLDYHGSRQAYINAKLRIIANVKTQDYLVFNYDQAELYDWIKDASCQLVPFSMVKIDDFVRQHGAYFEKGLLYYKGQVICSQDDIQIPGSHNIMNILAAIAVAKIKKIDDTAIVKEIKAFQGMPHRIQPLGDFMGRRFYNDSKATNTVATITALTSFQDPLHYIGGGLDRGNDFDDLIDHLSYVKAAYLYGQTKHKMAESFQKAGVKAIYLFDNLVEASQAAYQAAGQKEVVLFSPACASWDQFKTFEERGDLFIKTIRDLQESKAY